MQTNIKKRNPCSPHLSICISFSPEPNPRKKRGSSTSSAFSIPSAVLNGVLQGVASIQLHRGLHQAPVASELLAVCGALPRWRDGSIFNDSVVKTRVFSCVLFPCQLYRTKAQTSSNVYIFQKTMQLHSTYSTPITTTFKINVRERERETKSLRPRC